MKILMRHAIEIRCQIQRVPVQARRVPTLLIGEEDGVAAADLFGVSTAFPFTIFADGQRRIVAVKIGELHGDEANFILDQVERINTGKLPVEQARVMIRDEIKRLDALRAEKSPS